LRVVVAASVAALLIVAVVRAAAVVDSSCRGRGETIRTLLVYDAKTFIIRQSFPIANHYVLYRKAVPCGPIWTDA